MLRHALPIFFVCLAACGDADENRLSQDFAVVKGALAWTCEAPDFARVVVTDEPREYRHYAMPRDWENAADYSAGFKRHSAESARWPLGEICANARVVTQEAIEAEFAKDPRVPPGWEGFHATFEAEGFKGYSRPAYSRDGRRAALHIDNHCGPLCGMGLLVELELTTEGWKVVSAAGTWIS
ncbi:MAG: hypothetical protein H7Y89_11790 [Steroidobacteraceae bacterium]|nr:hypothetical protein [Steroidobacteraceae bacterium]